MNQPEILPCRCCGTAPVVKGASKFEEFKAAVTERFGPQAAPPLEKLWNEACDALGKEGDKV